ncbi:MAG: hypothetical protein C5B51_02560 [Terriglobia bacterium]|nr:MAG: hypothetical protein C5B51_02560 [Terriglobia bacterium]
MAKNHLLTRAAQKRIRGFACPYRAAIVRERWSHMAIYALVLFGGIGAAAADLVKAPPDFSGVWGVYRGGSGADPKLAPPAASPLALKPEYVKAYEARRAAEQAALARGEQLANGSVRCVPYGMPTMMSVAVYPVEIIQTPKQMTVIAEAFSEVRRIYLDRPQAPIDEVAPGYYGRSVGHWEGDSLMVDTVGIKTAVSGYRGMPHSDRMRITERFRLLTPEILHDTITIDDPVVLEKPFTYTLAYKRMPNYEMVEFVCDNNREYVDENGVVRMKLRDR